ncbi:hypothetical protein HYALB_00006717 [Hymenoscyphus albidus]|uniref:Uncharacterized protein n=1 Tax=Hymenoscyphus albidus TaxID=595503 RepID=A0A9N9LKQ5_9HELO|nr:hypothetical protein HYALB_00006717 [Hymenoscyphus albidus]
MRPVRSNTVPSWSVSSPSADAEKSPRCDGNGSKQSADIICNLDSKDAAIPRGPRKITRVQRASGPPPPPSAPVVITVFLLFGVFAEPTSIRSNNAWIIHNRNTNRFSSSATWRRRSKETSRVSTVLLILLFIPFMKQITRISESSPVLLLGRGGSISA